MGNTIRSLCLHCNDNIPFIEFVNNTNILIKCSCIQNEIAVSINEYLENYSENHDTYKFNNKCKKHGKIFTYYSNDKYYCPKCYYYPIRVEKIEEVSIKDIKEKIKLAEKHLNVYCLTLKNDTIRKFPKLHKKIENA